MANGTPLEDVTTKTPEETGVFASIKNTFNKVADFTDKAADVGADFLEGTIGTAWDATKDTFSAAKNIVSAINPFDDKESKFSLDGGGILDRQVDKQKFNDFELKQAEKLNNISGWTQAKDIVGTLGGVAVDWFKEKTGTDDLSKSLKIDKGVFNSTIEVYNQDLTGIDSQIQSIGNKYQTLNTFNEKVYQQYLKDKNVTGISDQADFELYKQKELARLNGIEQSRIIQEQNGFMSEISQLEQQKIQKQEELRGYLNENIITDEGKTGEQVYNEIQEKQTKETTDREYINTIGEIYNYSKEQVEDKFEAMGLAQNSTMPGYDTFKDAIIDDVAAENQYMMSIKGMKDLPNYEALADQAKVITNSSFKFKTDFAKRYLDMRNNPENKGMSEVDLRNKAVKEAWSNLSVEDKENYKSKEQFVTQVAVVRNIQQAGDKAKNLNPLSIKDFVESIVSTGQSLIDQAYDFETDDVPHYVKQDTRNIIYAGEGIGKNIASMITYNPDTLLSIALPSIGGKKIDTAIDAVKTAANSNKIVTGTLKIGYGNATTRFLGKAVANVTSSQMYGAIGDAVFDNVMMEAPTKAADAFNTLSNVLFDTTPFAFKSAFFGVGVEDSLKAGPRMTSMNRLAYEFLDKPTKESVQNFALAFGEKTGKKIGIGEAKTILDEGVNKFYRTTYNPFEYKDLMLTNNKLYDFIGEQLNGLSKDSANEVLTHKGIAFSYKQIGNELGLSYAEQYDITDAFNKINSPDIDPLKKQMEQVKFNNLLKDKMDSLTPGVGSLGGIKILKDKVNANEIEFNTLVKRAKSDIEFLKIAKTTEEFTEYLSKVNSSIKDVQGKFSNMKSEIYIKMKNVVDGTVTEMRIGKLADLSDKNIIDIFKEGKVKFTKGEFENKEFEIVDTKKDLLIEKFNKHIFQYKSNIEDLEKELNLIKGTSEGYKGSNTIEGTIQKMINGQSSKINMPWIKDEEQLDKVAILINKVVGDFIGSDYIGKEPININKSLKAKPPKNGKNYINEKGVASGEDILELISNDDSFINVSYGHFTGVDGKEVFLTYLMPGKQLLKTNEILHGALNIIKADGKINATALKNQGGKIIGSILGYSILKNGKVDIKSGILKTTAEYSAKNTDGLFDESGVLNEIAVKKEIHKVLSSIYKDSKEVNMTVEFITEAVKSLDKSQELIIKPIIYNLAYQYINNKPLIDAMIKKGSKFEGAFVDILLSKELRNNIADRIKLPLNEIPSEIVEYVSNSMNKYYKQLDNRKTKLEADLKQLEEYEKFLPEEQLGFLLEEKETLNNRIKSISNQLSKKVSTTNKEIDKFTRNNLFNFITSKSKQVGGEILGTSYAFLKNNIELKNISSQEDLLKLSKATIKNIQDLNKKDIDKLGKLVDDVIANVGNTKRIEEIRNGVKDVKIQKTLDKIIKLSTEADVPTVLKDLHTIGLDDAMKGILQYEDAISNNPLKKSLQAVFNNSNTGIDKDIEELFLKNFLGDSEGKTYNDIIEADTFKKFLDDINNINGNNKKEIKKSARKARDIFNKEIEKIFSGYSVIARKDGVQTDISKELIEDMQKDGKLFQNIKNIKNKKDWIKGKDGIGSIVKKVGKIFDANQKTAYEEIPLQMKNMIDATTSGKETRTQYLLGWNNDYIKSFLNPRYKFQKLLEYGNYKDFLKQSPIEGVIMFKEWFNGNKPTTHFNLLDYKNKDLLKKVDKELGEDLLKFKEEGYAFVAGFGDKDSGMHLYKAPQEILDLCSEKNYASEIYNVVEYAYANGYLFKNRILETHDDFLKSFTKYIDDKFDLEKGLLNSKQLFDELNNFMGVGKIELDKFEEGILTRLGNGRIGTFKLSNKEINYLKDKGVTSISRNDLAKSLKDIVDNDRLKELKEISQADVKPIKDIRKRESFNASVRNTFGDVKIKTTTYVIEQLKLAVPEAYDKYLKIEPDKLSDDEIDNLIVELKEINDNGLGITESILYLESVEKDKRAFLKRLKTMLSNGFYNDMQDGTSFASKDIFEMRADINGINLKNENIAKAYKQFKDHFYGEVDGVRFGGKTLFNEGTIKNELGEELSNAVVIGDSSVKLGYDLIDKTKSEIITINGRKYKAYKVKGTDTSFFKNASSDSFSFDGDVSFSNSIISSFSKENIERLTKLQKVKMQEAFDKHLKGLLEIDFKTGALSSVDIALLKNISETGMGYSSNSFIGNKLDAFMRDITEIMNKPQERGQSMFIYESNAKIKPNEVIMHPDSETVKVIREDVAMAKFGKELKDLTDEEKLKVDDNLFTVGYRYPVPSTYNLGTYKITLSTTYEEKVGTRYINPYENMGTDQVVPHPLATYMKLEGDNDGDHIFFISAFSEFGKICTNETNNVKIDGNYINNIRQAYDDKKLNPKFLSLEQVDKAAGGESQTLAESRLAALGAKSYIGNVAATIRTIKNLVYSKGTGIPIPKNQKKGFFDEYYGESMEDLKYDYLNLDGITELEKLNIDDRKFASIAAQLLQETLDFGNSGKSKFDPDWYAKLLKAAGIEEKDVDIVQSLYITPLSISYNQDMNRYNIPSIFKKTDKKTDINTKYFYNIVGAKRDLISFLGEIKSGDLTLPDILRAFNMPYDFTYILNKYKNYFSKIEDETMSGRLRQIYNDHFRLGQMGDKDRFVRKSFTSDKVKFSVPTLEQIDEMGDLVFKANNITGNNYGLLFQGKNYAIGAFEKLYHTLKGTELFDDAIKYLGEKNARDKRIIGNELFDNIKKLQKNNPEQAYNIGMLLYTGGEKKIINFLNEDDYIKFLNESDLAFANTRIKDNIRIKDLFKEIGVTIPEKQVDKIVDATDRFTDVISELQSEIDKAVQENKLDDLPVLQSALVKTQDDKVLLEQKIKELTSAQETKVDLINQYKAEKESIDLNDFYIPEFDHKLIDVDGNAVNYLFDEATGFAEKTRNGLNAKIIKFFERYVPQFTRDHTFINDMLGINNKSIKEAFDFTQLHFNEYRKYQKGIVMKLKNAGIEKYIDIARKIQYSMLDNIDGKYIARDNESMLKLIKTHLGTYGNLINDKEFTDALFDYRDGAITKISDVLNELTAVGYKVADHYKGGEAFSLVLDTLEAHKGDTQLALRLNGFLSKDQFRLHLIDKMGELGEMDGVFKRKISNGTVNLMLEVLYGGQSKGREKIFGGLQSIHYDMNYGKMSLVTGNGIMSGIAQMLPNYVELMSYMRKNLTDIAEGYKAIKVLGILDSESTIQYGSSIGKDFTEYGYLDGTIEKALSLIGVKSIKGNHAVAVLHAILTNPLGGTDYSIETLRKMVATVNTMKKLKIKNADELEKNIVKYGRDYEAAVKHEARKAFAESGGGVNSSSALYKDTVFNHLHNYVDIWGVRFATKSLGYLMNWSYNKAATLIEKEGALGYAVKDLINGNYRSAKAHFDDFMVYNSMIAHQSMLAMGLYMKMEKYEKNNNDRVSFSDFRDTFSNSVVALGILLDKHLAAWESAKDAGGDFNDRLGYTTVGLIRHTFRLFGQANFVATMYKHYMYTQAEGKGDLFNSLQYAMKQHYSSYIKYTGMEQMDNIYGTLDTNAKLGLLGTGAQTDTEKAFEDLSNGNYFGIYKNKGFIKALVDMFPSLLSKNFTSTPAALQSLISKDLIKTVMEDKELSQLIRGGGFGMGKGEYNIEQLFGKIGSTLDNEQYNSVLDIYKQLSDYNYNYLKTTGIKEDSYTQSTADRVLHEMIDKALVKEGYNIKDLIAQSGLTPEMTKTLAVLETKHGFKTPLVISLLIENEYNAKVKELKETQGKLTGQISAYGTVYKDLAEEDKMGLKRDLLVKYQQYFNLNRQLGMDVISTAITMKHGDKLDEIQKNFKGNSGKDMLDFMQKSFVIGQVAKSGDTSVSKLHSRYALAAKGLGANDTTTVIVNNFLHKLFANDNLNHKEKLANAAGFLSGLDKATYGMLTNNEEFNKLTDESKKVLANWIYKINSESIDYDSNSLLNQLNGKSYGGSGSSKAYFKLLYPKYKSGSFEGARPNYSKQFAPIQKMIPTVARYIDKDNNGYLRGTNPYGHTEGVYNNLKNPYMKQYKDLLIEQLFYGYKSKGIIKPVYASDKVDKTYKKNINIKKAKSVKQEKTFTKPKAYKKHTRNLFINSPLATYGGE